MTQVQENIFQNFCSVSRQVQKLDQEIKQKDVTPDKRIELHKALESVQGTLEQLRQRATQTAMLAKNQFSQMEEMEGQIVSLYREIEDRFEEYEIQLISKEALELGSSLKSGKMFSVARHINTLSHNIHFLFQHRKPSLAHRKIIQLAIKLVDHAKELLSKKGDVPEEQMRLIRLLTTLLEEALRRSQSSMDIEEGELMMELYEIADLYHHKQVHEGLVRLNMVRSLLSKSQQRRIDEANSPEEIVEILLAIADGDPCIEWEGRGASTHSNIYSLFHAQA